MMGTALDCVVALSVVWPDVLRRLPAREAVVKLPKPSIVSNVQMESRSPGEGYIAVGDGCEYITY